jgi:hypothetical protein
VTYFPRIVHVQVAEEDLIVRIPLRLFTPVICYDISAVKTTILGGLRTAHKILLQFASSTLTKLCSMALADMQTQLRWLIQVPNTPHELHSRQMFCDSLPQLLQKHQHFVTIANGQMALLQNFDCILDDAAAALFYETVYLPKTIVQTVAQQLPLLQELQQKFVQEHQQQLAGFLADLQQAEYDIRQFHSYSDVDRTELYDTKPSFYYRKPVLIFLADTQT